MGWIISNMAVQTSFGNEQVVDPENSLKIYSSEPYSSVKKAGLKILLDGYVLPRMEYYNENQHLDQLELVEELFVRYGLNLVHHLKGVFTIILIHNDKIYILSDIHGLKFYFIYTSGAGYIISDELSSIKPRAGLTLCPENAAIYTLMNNFPGRLTAFRHVARSSPASILKVSGKIDESVYWEPEKLLDLDPGNYSMQDYASFYSNLCKQYARYLKPESVSLTLTGGMDSRLILSLMLSAGCDCDAFSYGEAGSSDVSVARVLSGALGLKFSHYHPEIDAAWFKGMADRIVKDGKTIISIHRAHRYQAFLEHCQSDAKSRMVITGHMGGELYRNFYRDGLIITDQIYHILEGYIPNEKQIESLLKENFMLPGKLDLPRVLEVLHGLGYGTENPRLNRLNFTFKQLTRHHGQDIYLLSGLIDFAVPFYLDIDLVNFMFASRHNFLYNEKNGKSRTYQSQKLFMDLITRFSTRAAGIPFAKRGYYAPGEFSKNPRPVLYLKRVYRYLLRDKIVPNFVHGSWMNKFIRNELNKLPPGFEDIFNTEKMKAELDRSECLHEACWRRFSNPVYIKHIMDTTLSKEL